MTGHCHLLFFRPAELLPHYYNSMIYLLRETSYCIDHKTVLSHYFFHPAESNAELTSSVKSIFPPGGNFDSLFHLNDIIAEFPPGGKFLTVLI